MSRMGEQLYGLTARTAGQVRQMLADGGGIGDSPISGAPARGVTWVKVTGAADTDGWHPAVVTLTAGGVWEDLTARVFVAEAELAGLVVGNRYPCTRTGDDSLGRARFRTALGVAALSHALSNCLRRFRGWKPDTTCVSIEVGGSGECANVALQTMTGSWSDIAAAWVGDDPIPTPLGQAFVSVAGVSGSPVATLTIPGLSAGPLTIPGTYLGCFGGGLAFDFTDDRLCTAVGSGPPIPCPDSGLTVVVRCIDCAIAVPCLNVPLPRRICLNLVTSNPDGSGEVTFTGVTLVYGATFGHSHGVFWPDPTPPEKAWAALVEVSGTWYYFSLRLAGGGPGRCLQLMLATGPIPGTESYAPGWIYYPPLDLDNPLPAAGSGLWVWPGAVAQTVGTYTLSDATAGCEAAAPVAYDCAAGECVETVGGRFVNDPTCQGCPGGSPCLDAEGEPLASHPNLHLVIPDGLFAGEYTGVWDATEMNYLFTGLPPGLEEFATFARVRCAAGTWYLIVVDTPEGSYSQDQATTVSTTPFGLVFPGFQFASTGDLTVSLAA